MIGMGFRTNIFLPGKIETEIFSTSIAELEGILVQSCATDLTVMGLHNIKETLGSRIRGFTGSSGCIMIFAQRFDNVLRIHLSYVRMSPFVVASKISLDSLNP
jgi:hypothetical protein